MRRFLPGASTGLVSALAVVACLAVPAASVPACSQVSPAVFPILDKVEQTVLADIEAGKGLPQITIDVAAVVAAQLVPEQISPDVDRLVEDALTLLIDSGLVPANWLTAAKGMKAEVHAKLVAKGAVQ